MKWLWIAFALVWALSIVIDGRHRTAASRPPRADPVPKPPPTDPLPALLASRETH